MDTKVRPEVVPVVVRAKSGQHCLETDCFDEGIGASENQGDRDEEGRDQQGENRQVFVANEQ